MSLLESQIAAQKKWQLKPEFRKLDIFDRLLENEFSPRESRELLLNQRLVNMLSFAFATVPYYQALAEKHDIDPGSIKGVSDLSRLPMLTKADAQLAERNLWANQLPPNIRLGGYSQTSGTTGQPLVIQYSLNAMRFFSFLKQREYRMWDFDPGRLMLSVRNAVDLPKINGEPLADGQEYAGQSWSFVGNFFKTGPAKAFNDTNPVDDIVDWLLQHDNFYLLSLSAPLEHMAINMAAREAASPVLGAVAISQQLTKSMRSLVETQLSPHLHQNYGLNEIGIVAVRCPESGYYHVHNEHCIVEVCDDEGRPCQPGEKGRLLVTGLNNFAMPLIRYDADDMATLPEKPCPCGRQMQSFMNIQGRYRRTAHLPEGTWRYWDRVVDCISNASKEELSTIEQYQLHQLSAENFQLKLKTKEEVAPSLIEKIYSEWQKVDTAIKPVLHIRQLNEIAQQGRKFQNFISDLAPAEQEE